MDSGFNLIPFDTYADLQVDGNGYYKQITDLKKQNPSLKVLISFGGWTFSQGNAGLLQSMASNAQNRQKFVKSVVQFMKQYNFDGFDVDWEYPTSAVKSAYAQLINDLRAEFDRNSPKFLLTAAVPAGIPNIDAGFDVPSLAKPFDYLNIMAYDMQDGGRTSFNAPLYDRNGDKLSVKTAADYWASKGMPKNKIIVGLAAYGRGFTLQSTSNTGVGAPVSGPAPGLTYSVEGGMAFYYEICDMLNSGGKRYWDDVQQVPYVVKGNLWYGYDDPQSIGLKLQWIKSNGYGGAFVWALYEDDFNGKSCGGVKYPITSKMNEILGNGQPPATVKPEPQPQTTAPVVTTQAPNKPPPSGKFKCPGAGLFADPANCSKYYQCVDANTPVSMSCQPGLNYNAARQYCDWPANVKC
jgi:chitinase